MSNQQDAILDHVAKQIPVVLIAQMTGESLQTIRKTVREARAAGHDLPDLKLLPKKVVPTAPTHIVVPVRLKNILQLRSEKLGITPAEYAARVLENHLLKTGTKT